MREPSWHRNYKSRRTRARKALRSYSTFSEIGHPPLEALARQASHLSNHHGSQVPKMTSQQQASMATARDTLQQRDAAFQHWAKSNPFHEGFTQGLSKGFEPGHVHPDLVMHNANSKRVRAQGPDLFPRYSTRDQSRSPSPFRPSIQPHMLQFGNTFANMNLPDCPEK